MLRHLTLEKEYPEFSYSMQYKDMQGIINDNKNRFHTTAISAYQKAHNLHAYDAFDK